MLKRIYITIIIIIYSLPGITQTYIYQPLVFNNFTPAWQHAPIDSSLIGENRFDGRNHITLSKSPTCYVLFEDNLYISPSTETTDFGVDGGLIERINLLTGKVDWINTFDLRTGDRQEYIQDLYIDDQRRLNVVSFRRIVVPIPDPFASYHEKGDSSVISIRKYDIETGELLEHKAAQSSDYQSVRLRHSIFNSTFFKGDKKGNFQYIEKVNRFGLEFRQYTIDENGHQTRPMKHDSLIFDEPFSGFTNFSRPVFIVSKDTMLILSHDGSGQNPGNMRQSRLTVYNEHFEKNREFFLDDIIMYNFRSLYLDNADNKFIYIQVEPWLEPVEKYHNEHIIMDYEGNIIKRFSTIRDGDYYFPFIITYLEKEDEFLVVGVIRDRTFRLSFFKTTGFDELEKLKTLSYPNSEYFYDPKELIQLANGDIFMHGINHFWPLHENFPQAFWYTWLRLNAEDIGLTSTKETENVRLISIYPNPASDRITISLEEDQSGVIDILDHMGREVYVTDSEANEGLNHIDIGYLPTGMYIVRVTDKTGRIRGMGRFVKMN